MQYFYKSLYSNALQYTRFLDVSCIKLPPGHWIIAASYFAFRLFYSSGNGVKRLLPAESGMKRLPVELDNGHSGLASHISKNYLGNWERGALGFGKRLDDAVSQSGRISI